MVGIRAHFDGSVIVPDEALSVSSDTPVVVLIESANAASTTDLETATRQYYQSLSSQDDDAWE